MIPTARAPFGRRPRSLAGPRASTGRRSGSVGLCRQRTADHTPQRRRPPPKGGGDYNRRAWRRPPSKAAQPRRCGGPRLKASAVNTTAGRVLGLSLPRVGSRFTHYTSPRRTVIKRVICGAVSAIVNRHLAFGHLSREPRVAFYRQRRLVERVVFDLIRRPGLFSQSLDEGAARSCRHPAFQPPHQVVRQAYEELLGRHGNVPLSR